jgi:glycerophosphoryl diester phosphodiesterase
MKIIGHRGARKLAPENTLAAIAKALEYGVDEIEIDVRVTKDNHVVLSHDPVLRIKSQNFATNAHTLDELREHKTDLTTLADTIRVVDRKVPLMIEVKPKEPIEPIVNVIERFLSEGWEPSDFILGSFSQRTLEQLHDALPQIETIVIEKFSALYAMHRARRVSSKKISLHHNFLWFITIANMRKKKYELYSYTINNPRKAKRWAKRGLSGTITDDPSLFNKKRS